MQAGAILLFLIPIAVLAALVLVFLKARAVVLQGGFKALQKPVIIFVSILLVLLAVIGIYYCVSHRLWIKTTGELKSGFPEIKDISFYKPTPTLNVRFCTDDTVDFEKSEKIFLAFLGKLDDELLYEMINNADYYAPSDISVFFVSDSGEFISEFSAYADFDDWTNIYANGNYLQGEKYKRLK